MPMPMPLLKPNFMSPLRAACTGMAAALWLGLSGCASLPPGSGFPKQASTALAQPEATRLGRQFYEAALAHPGASGFRIIPIGVEGFLLRRQMLDAAERSLDLQYFIFHNDTTGGLLVQALLRAADRGVHVRLLLDDGDIEPGDEALARLSAHPGIELRYFNPLAYRGSDERLRAAEFVMSLHRLDYRMHNKLLVVDNSVALAGGRNVGDAYFQIDPEGQLADEDVVAAGPVVKALSRSFDDFWNSARAIPAEALGSGRATAQALAELQAMLASRETELRADLPPSMKALDSAQPWAGLLDGSLPLAWGRSELLYDSPEKRQVVRGERWGHRMLEPIKQAMTAVQQELLLVTPYFVPTDEEVALLRALAARQVRVSVLTNSLESTDQVAAQAGYARHRQALLAAGIRLFELKARPHGTRGLGQSQAMSRHGQLGLHAKLFVFDRQRVFLGSMNLDHRSANLNTEIGLIIENTALAAQTAERFAAMTQPANAYEVQALDDGLGKPLLRWRFQDEKARWIEQFVDPARDGWQRFKFSLWKLIPADSEL